MSTVFIVAGAISVAIACIGVVLWFSMKITERKEGSDTGDWGSANSDVAGGYQAPGYDCGADAGGCDQ